MLERHKNEQTYMCINTASVKSVTFAPFFRLASGWWYVNDISGTTISTISSIRFKTRSPGADRYHPFPVTGYPEWKSAGEFVS
jgi:hypothetical protein